MTDTFDKTLTATVVATRVMVMIGARMLLDLSPEMTLPQYRALVILSYKGPQSLTELAAHVSVSGATAGRMAAKMERDGLVERQKHPGDGRLVTVVLSEAGKDLVDRVTAARSETFAEIIRKMTPRQQTELALALEAFTAAAGESVYDWMAYMPGE